LGFQPYAFFAITKVDWAPPRATACRHVLVRRPPLPAFHLSRLTIEEYAFGVNMVLTTSRKLPLSPYEVFSVVPAGGSTSHKADINLPVQTPMVGTCIVGERLFGRLGALHTAYNPFKLYGSAGRGRHEAKPPHIVFAELDDNPQDACAFLNAYGPLLMEYAFLDAKQLSDWGETSAGSPAPAQHFEEVGIKAQIPTRPRHCSSAYCACDLDRFRKVQWEFELTFRLALAIREKADVRTSAIKTVLKNAGVGWKGSGEALLQKAIDHVRSTINDNLDLSSPRVVRTINRRSVEAVWGCYSLLASLYLMLFLDLIGAHRTVACRKCGMIFYADRSRVLYCSGLCENRARALRAYYKTKIKPSSNGVKQRKHDRRRRRAKSSPRIRPA